MDQRVHAVASRTTGERPAARLEIEHDLLGGSPRVRFDSDYVEVRRVHNVLPFVSIDSNRYSVPPEALGHKVEIRRKVNGVTVEIRLAGRLTATHRLVAGRLVDVWDPEHCRAAETLALGWKTDRLDLRVIESGEEAPAVVRLELDDGYDIDPPDLDDRYAVTIESLRLDRTYITFERLVPSNAPSGLTFASLAWVPSMTGATANRWSGYIDATSTGEKYSGGACEPLRRSTGCRTAPRRKVGPMRSASFNT